VSAFQLFQTGKQKKVTGIPEIILRNRPHGSATRPTEALRPKHSMAALQDDFAADTVPMPLVFVIAEGADQVEQDTAETGLSEMSLHRDLIKF